MILLFRHKLVKMIFLNEFPSKKLPLEENEVLIMFSVILETIPHCTSVVKRRNYPNVLIVGFFLFSSETSFIGQTYHGSKYFYFMTLYSTKKTLYWPLKRVLCFLLQSEVQVRMLLIYLRRSRLSVKVNHVALLNRFLWRFC